MQIDPTAITLGGPGENIRLEDTPDECPRCHRNVHPPLLITAKLSEFNTVQGIFRCTHLKCQELFIANYVSTVRSEASREVYRLASVSPVNAQKATFPATVEGVSPTFVAIFNQTMEAESKKLDQLVGIGLRKALEFLIKDFAVAEHPQKDEEIRKSQLASCINKYISDPNVKECARRAAWLGNDETHYTRKWESKDVGDLKLLVRLTVNWIDNSLLTKKYIAEMGSS